MPVIITKKKDEKNLGPMDPLPQTKKKNGYAYTLIERTENAAIYSMVNEQYPEDTSVGYEVFQITISKPCAIQQKSGVKKGMWYQYPAKEKFPGNEDFGKTAWSFSDLDVAMMKYGEIA